jgi:D-apiose dehydrogenase
VATVRAPSSRAAGTRPRLRVALVGAGYISAQHAPAWVASPDADLVAICDLDRERAERRRAQLGELGHADVTVHTDVAAMLAEVEPDAVDLASRPEAHRALVEQAARAGVHVLCQKPLASSLADAQAMVEICRQATVRFMVLEMWRYLPWYRDIKRVLEAGEIGPAHYLRVLGPREPLRRVRPVHETQPYLADMPRLIIYEMFVHWIDCARFLLGEIARVDARAGRVNAAVAGEDWAVVLLGHHGGGTSVIESSWATPGDAPTVRREGDVLVEGAAGALHLDPATLELRRSGPGGTIVVARYASLDDAFQKAFAGCIGHFARAVRFDEPFESPAEDNARTLSATLAAYDSLDRRAGVTPA